jgi:hypothetical protein
LPILTTQCSDDHWGGSCEFKNEDAWRKAIGLYCGRFDPGVIYSVGNEYWEKFRDVEDGDGKLQVFYGTLFGVLGVGVEGFIERVQAC